MPIEEESGYPAMEWPPGYRSLGDKHCLSCTKWRNGKTMELGLADQLTVRAAIICLRLGKLPSQVMAEDARTLEVMETLWRTAYVMQRAVRPSLGYAKKGDADGVP